MDCLHLNVCLSSGFDMSIILVLAIYVHNHVRVESDVIMNL